MQNPKIVVSKETKLILDKIKLCDDETYDSVIVRLIKDKGIEVVGYGKKKN
jgi:hypothetical protein